MDTFTAADLEALMAYKDDFCVSLYMPAHRSGPDIRQDPIRLKNLLTQAGEKLIRRGMKGSVAGDFLKPVRGLLEDALFWRHQSEGLAVFAGDGFFRSYRLPLKFRELADVSGRFHIKPLLYFLSGDGKFYLLALSQNETKFFEGSRYALSELDLHGSPGSLAAALRYDLFEKQLQVRTFAAGGEQGAVFHGHAVGADESKQNLRRFFLQIDNGLRELLKGEKAPLVLAGVEYLFPLFREASTYPHLLENGIPGNPEDMRPAELHNRAWPVVEPYFLESRRKALARHRELAGTGLASSDISIIVPAAANGRVDSLFVVSDGHVWGQFEESAGLIEVHSTHREPDEDLLDTAALHTILKGGEVFASGQGDMWEGSQISAVFRY